MPINSRTLLDAIGDVIPHTLVSDVFQSPDAPPVFVDPTIEAESSEEPFGEEVVLISAPAAVGKSTVARYLASEAGIPLLDLARVPVAAGSLRGLVGGYIESDPPAVDAFLQGRLPLIVDALDEGRIRSGEDAFLQFLFTAWELIERGEGSSGPLMVMFGRPNTIGDVETSLELHNSERDSDSQVRFLHVELAFFDEDGALDLVKRYAKSADEGSERIDRQWGAIEITIRSYFASIGRALGIGDSQALWTDDLGRSFAGYAPVLAALGALIALTPDYQRLTSTLEKDHADAWAPIEEVIQLILDREAGKFRDALVPQVSDEDFLPETCYNAAEQISYLFAHVGGERTLRGVLPDSLRGPDAVAYTNAVNLMIPEHPFVRDRMFANPVFAGFVLASGIYNAGSDGLRGPPESLGKAARTPFLWRSFSNLARSSNRTIAGESLGYLLTSRWNDPGETPGPLHITSDGRKLIVRLPNDELAIHADPPIRFFERVQDLVINLDTDEFTVELAGQAVTVSGPVVFLIPSLRLSTEKLFFEGSVWIEAGRLEPKESLTLTVAPEATVGWNAAVNEHYPWSRTDTQLTRNPLVDPEPVNQLEAMIADVVKHAPSHSVVVDARNLSVAQDEPRWGWTKRRYEAIFRRFLRLLLDEDKAVLRHIDTSAHRPRSRLTFRFSWLDLAKVVRGEIEVPDLEAMIQRAMDEFPQKMLFTEET